uniref:Uncharacterized protein n=1 Tax=Chromera velia CCMP2878 TaxID=1169474 RepID=A0A0G4HP06_9ALVE|eukprot:Cvel_29669.t1-p1 / transcript=Cvel_29669.t1 / gene=Cvel_29669 / organism=Chromera_velia_CCMP2878 / gene_product=hypothetical protein / transcript_product=hypothetical protein / location=Cvel_scaffold4101:1613-1924(+) / protein_length=104 / sequence_SO=supercontig / SO=protein_coding / is_pseudo=false
MDASLKGSASQRSSSVGLSPSSAPRSESSSDVSSEWIPCVVESLGRSRALRPSAFALRARDSSSSSPLMTCGSQGVALGSLREEARWGQEGLRGNYSICFWTVG